MEKDWYETCEMAGDLQLRVLPTRHFSGRGFRRNTTLWISFLLQTPAMKIYLGGDSGYDKHYAEIGEQYGPIHLAILDNGQYNEAWKYIHNLPEDVLKAAKDLRAKRILPVHSSKFALANHAWDEPLLKVCENCAANNIKLVTPMIGQAVYLQDGEQQFSKWWEGVE